MFVLGVLVSLKTTHEILSNRESGYGRYDLAIIPKTDFNGTAILFEFKSSKDEKDSLSKMAKEALKQIDKKKYETNLSRPTIKKIVKIGLAFRTKEVEIAYTNEKI